MKEKISAFFFALLFFILYLLIATDFHVFTYFTAFWPELHLYSATAAVCLLAIYRTKPVVLAKTGKIILKYSKLIIPILMFAATLAVNRFVILTEQPEDGVHYVWLAKLIANGRFYLEIPDFYEHYRGVFMFVRDGKYTSIFLPGFSLFMAPFAKFGLEYLFNPIVAGINTFLVGIHAEKLKNGYAALIAMLLFSFSTTHILHGALYFPHHFGLMLVLLSSYFLIYKHSKSLNILFAGFLIAYMLFIRPQNAVYVYAAFTVYILAKQRSFKNAALFTVPFLFFGGLLCCYNSFFTGEPFVFTQDVVFNLLDLKDFCHRPGLGKGCFFTSRFEDSLPFTGTTIPYLASISFLRLNSFVHRITFHQIMLLFIFPAIFSKPYKYFPYYFTPLCALAFYFWFFIEGNYAGPRYLLESGAMILIAAACGFAEVFECLNGKDTPFSKVCAVLMNGIFVGMLVFFTFCVLPLFLTRTPFGDNPKELKKVIAENKIENSIVLIPFYFGFHSESILKIQDNPPFDSRGNLIMYSLGTLDENILKFYSEQDFKEVWRIEISSENNLERTYSATKLGFKKDDGVSYINFMAKYLPLSGEPHFIFGPVSTGNKFTEDFLGYYTPEKSDFFGIAVVFGEPDGKNYFLAEHTMAQDGIYDVKLNFVPTKCTTRFNIEINGVESAVFDNEKHESDTVPKTLEFSAEMRKGKNSIKFVPEANGCLILGNAVLQKR
ncbi:hypothetical protein J5690_07105 [bacterium]|nr:hypothetical protein [bacterium]